MPLFDVEIKATIRKTYQVEAETADLAEEEAHQIFSVLCDDVDEDYDQETLEVIELVEATEFI